MSKLTRGIRRLLRPFKKNTGTLPRRIKASGLNFNHQAISANAIKVVRRLQEHGYEAYLVGGCIRDLLIGQTPKDFDVVTSAHPDQINKIFRNCRLIGRRFRLAHIYFSGEIIEVATFRAGTVTQETEANNGHSHRKTENGQIIRDNIYGTLADDVWRRDFTINALYYDPIGNVILDYVDGLNDIQSSNIRMIGDPEQRYQEDPVRMLRAVRFACKLAFNIEQHTAAPITELAKLIEAVPAARLFEETNKLFLSGYAEQTLRQLRHYHLFAKLYPSIHAILAAGHEPHAERLLNSAMQDTDKRVAENKPVTPAYLLAVFLWYPLKVREYELINNNTPPYKAFHQACHEIISAQLRSIAIPKRLLATTKDIWLMQPRFEHRQGKRPLRLLEQLKFRAAYDFLYLRARSGEPVQELAEWWNHFQQADDNQQQQLISTKGEGTGRHLQRKRRRRRKPTDKDKQQVTVKKDSPL
ncbi:Poly(A) polymerase I precursor [Piscirickettsia salmonis]|uniref:polynucleotide adenylyltransferase PcnB n=1 Tax=Piscirickettsia salmonis TaxID=1238 RepID=UPI0012B97CFD|nr:polynucleotide adenylyltransferase PcnB [Piscirickettsia salmonis]QGP51782.1 Poly(A) polymerase I precursor [Piscirickettsia salmonis]